MIAALIERRQRRKILRRLRSNVLENSGDEMIDAIRDGAATVDD